MKEKKEEKTNVPRWIVKLSTSGNLEEIAVAIVAFLIWGSLCLLYFDPINNRILEILIIIAIIGILYRVFFYVKKKLSLIDEKKADNKPGEL